MIKLRHDALDKKIDEAYNEVNEMRSQQLILKEEMQSYIGMNALNLVKQKYDWNIVGKKIKNQLA